MAESKDHPRGEKFQRTCYLLSTAYKRVQHCYGPDYRLSKDLKKWEFTLFKAAAKAFVEIKTRMISAPVMRLPNFSKIFEVACDAFGIGIGGS